MNLSLTLPSPTLLPLSSERDRERESVWERQVEVISSGNKMPCSRLKGWGQDRREISGKVDLSEGWGGGKGSRNGEVDATLTTFKLQKTTFIFIFKKKHLDFFLFLFLQMLYFIIWRKFFKTFWELVEEKRKKNFILIIDILIYFVDIISPVKFHHFFSFSLQR